MPCQTKNQGGRISAATMIEVLAGVVNAHEIENLASSLPGPRIGHNRASCLGARLSLADLPAREGRLEQLRVDEIDVGITVERRANTFRRKDHTSWPG